MNTNEYDPTDFAPIPNYEKGYPDIAIVLLKLGQIVTTKVPEKSGVRLRSLIRLINKHRNVLSRGFKPKEIKNLVESLGGEVRGGGVVVSWDEVPGGNYNSPNDLIFRFTKLHLPNPTRDNAIQPQVQ